MAQFRKMFDEFKSTFITDDVLKENEWHANVVVATVMLNLFLVILVSWILGMFGIIEQESIIMTYYVIFSGLILVIPAIICFIFRGEKSWLKYLLLIALILVLSKVSNSLSYISALFMVIPVILSARYYSKNYTIMVAIITVISFLIFAFINGVNYLENPQSLVLVILLYYVIVSSSVQISRSGKNMIERQQEITKKESRIETELNLANEIQKNMLPSIFPPFPEHKEIDIYAKMIPAKEVGGDFYDMFLIDDDHLAFLVADVSGKGVPASLFMMISKILIKNVTEIEKNIADVFTNVNNMLCDGNKVGQFVTVWFGILDLKTGHIEYVNAGHNPPLIYSNKTGKFEYLKTKSNLVLAGIENIKYEKQEIQIEPGDKIFLYTDGVVEATNTQNKLYGTERLKDFLDKNVNLSVEELINELKKDIDKFVGNREQFDDITMLELFYKKRKADLEDKKEFKADVSELPKVQEFVKSKFEENNCNLKIINQVNLFVEEIFVNIANYAFKDKDGTCMLQVEFDGNNKYEITFEDSGIPFNPLEKEEVDVNASLEDRQIGGLGIFITKNIVDNIDYKYEDGKNILKITKII